MRTSETINKSIKLSEGEDFNFLRREGIKHIEKLAGDVWTDYNTHDPGITLLEALCYAITDLAYRSRFSMKDLLAQEKPGSAAWKNIFYTAKEILPCNPLTINDYRKLIIDINGVRNAWITISNDCEIPIYLDIDQLKNLETGLKDEIKEHQPCDCGDKLKLPYHNDESKKNVEGLNFNKGKIIELNGLYKIIVEYDEEITENKRESEIRKEVIKVLHAHRNVCEDFLGVSEAEYLAFYLQTKINLHENADADMVLAEICYQVQNYFTPAIKFYSLDELIEKDIPVDEIFEGPVLDHGFIPDNELEKTDMFRDMRLSDIINFVSDIDGIHSLRSFNITDNIKDNDDPCAGEVFFSEWTEKMKLEKLLGLLSIEDILKSFENSLEEEYVPVSDIHFYKPSGEVTINPKRFAKLLNDLKGKDKYLKMEGFKNDFDVPIGENMELDNFYPVQYELPFIYRVGESGLPLMEGKKRLVQALQLKGYLAIFEQLFLNYMKQLGGLNEILSFNDIVFKGKSVHSDNDPCVPGKKTEDKNEDHNESNLIIYKEDGEIKEKIIGYKCLYYDAEKYINELQSVIQPESEFEEHRNKILDHLLARFNEDMSEYAAMMKYMYPHDYLFRIIKNKTDLLADYPEISGNRGKAFNYQLESEGIDDESTDKDEKEIELNISGLEKRIARLIGMKSYKRKDLAPLNLHVEKDDGGKMRITLYDGIDKKHDKILLRTVWYDAKCEDDIMHWFIDSGCCSNNFFEYPERRLPHHRYHQHHGNKFSFVLKDSEGREIASSPIYETPELRNEALKKAKCHLWKICYGEGFHMIEHILLRPKGDEQIDEVINEKGDVTQGSPFRLLDICLDECDLNIERHDGGAKRYKFEMEVWPLKKCKDGKRWNVKLTKRKENGATDYVVLEKQFKDYELASDFISKVREYGSDAGNYEICQADNRNYYFRLKDENRITLVESNCFKDYSPLSPEANVRRGKKDCSAPIIKDIIAERDELKEFLAYELDLYCCEEPCNHNEDPYSFRITFVLPCWPKRFRDKGFREFVKKTIYAETPAHIQVNIFWVGIEEMRNYEEAYFNWLIEIAYNDVPANDLCNNFIEQFLHLKNCDEHCEELLDELGKK